MTQHLAAIPTMIEAENLGQLEELKIIFNEAKNTDFLVLRSKEGDFMAYFHDARKKPTLKETVEWMEETDNLSFPGNVSILNGIKSRYDEKFHAELDGVISEVMDTYLQRSAMMKKLAEDPEFMQLLQGLTAQLPPEVQRPTVKLK